MQDALGARSGSHRQKRRHEGGGRHLDLGGGAKGPKTDLDRGDPQQQAQPKAKNQHPGGDADALWVAGGPDQGLLPDAGPAPEPAGPPLAQQTGLHTFFCVL